ncbi:leukocyte cell-derived chemotaxin 1-like [Morone saxatilis]|uniref:leukocyte cell-derived chemotaxin 1-like n=1 Tax=Morone saxatilis TaxID=34816 RepID=UPI0015E1E990|nr:leukocyte cell-derived chemotaxin 1-like [Morone saxatilis]
MAGNSEKVPIASAGPEDLHQFMPPAYSAVAVKPAATGRLLKAGIAVLIAGALLLLLGAVGAFYFWNNNEKHVYNVHYSMSINGKVEEGTMEIDTASNMERFSTGSGADEAVEVHDFEIGITGIRFSGGEKCYIKTQVKARLPDVDALNKDSMTFDLRGLEGEQGTMNHDPMLDHQGVCCTECRRSHTHCQRICEPLGGYHPWPYHYRGCRVVCRVIMPCNWWVARILGLV